MKLVPASVSQMVSRQGLLASKNAPTILFASGVAGMIGSTVLACHATLKMEEVLRVHRNDIRTAKSVKMSNGEENLEHKDGGVLLEEDKVTYTDNDYRRDVAIIFSRSIVRTAKLYAPAIILGSASIACLTKSHDILQKRNAALTAAYIAVDEAFKQYRERVIDEYGEEKDREFRYGSVEVDMVDENGKMYTEKQPDGTPSMYARFFDEYSSSWSKEPDYNFVFLLHTQHMANDHLRARGHLFLNEVYDMLGIDRTQAGQVVGWVISKDGDNYVDFGIFKDARHSAEVRDFINGRNNAVLLDFNVDGVIYDKIDTNKERLRWQS